MAEPEGQIERLQQVFSLLNEPAEGKICPAILGLVEEGEEVMEVRTRRVSTQDIWAVRRPWSITRLRVMALWSHELTSSA